MLERALFYATVFFANIIQAITGFAGTVLAMPISLILVGYGVAKPVLNALGLAASIGVVCSSYKKVNLHEFTKILSIMLIGVLAGEIAADMFDITASRTLYEALGATIIAFSLMGCLSYALLKDVGLANLLPTKKNTFEVFNNGVTYVILCMAGLVHGLFVCGGPLLVVYAERKLKDKDEFRATLSACWIVLNSLIFLSDATSGYFALQTAKALLVCMAVLIAAVLIGNFVAKKLKAKAFMALTYVLMFASGISLFFK